MITSGEVGLTAAVGAVGIGIATLWGQLRSADRAAASSRLVAHEDRLWQRRADAYVSWLVENDHWDDQRAAFAALALREVRPGKAEQEAEPDFAVQRERRARASAFASEHVRRLVDAALEADKQFLIAVILLNQDPSDPGVEARRNSVEVALANARDADKTIAEQMRIELQERPA